MEMILNNPIGYIDTFLLIFVRMMGVMMMLPIFSNRNVPQMTKIGLSIFTSMIVLSTSSLQAPVSSENVIGYALAVILEFIVGYTIGFSAYMVFSILSLAGQFIDMQIGFSMVNVFDPMSQIQLTITGNVYYYILMMITLVTNAHHHFLRAFLESFTYVPLGGMVISPGLNDALIGFMTDYFMMALRIATPIFFVMLITNVILGVLARAVPQLNLFVIGFPIKILFGLSTIFVVLTVFSRVSDELISESQKQMLRMIEGMRPE